MQTGNIAPLSYDIPHRLHAPAKLNLRLKVVGRRADGYHLLSMLNAAIDFADLLEVTVRRNAGVDLEICCAAGVSPPPVEGNSVIKAAEAFCRAFEIHDGLQIRLTKRVPSGAGMGGGSSDAAALLTFLAAFYAIPNFAPLAAVALRVGADVPFLLRGGFAAVRGIGEEIEPLDGRFLQSRPCLLVIPPLHLPTPAVFGALRTRQGGARSLTSREDLELATFCATVAAGADFDTLYAALLRLCENDLEEAALMLAPALAPMLQKLRSSGRWTACMTGSGSALFVLPNAAELQDDELMAEVSETLHDPSIRLVAARLLANSAY